MRKITYKMALLPMALMVLVISANAVTGNSSGHAAQANSAPDVTLRAGSGSTIAFWTQNGETIDNDPPQTMDIPHLVLFRNGALTDPNERTLIVEVSGIEVPPAGVTVTLQLATQHGDPDLGGGPEHRIPVWRESQRIINSMSTTQTGGTATFVHEFSPSVISGTQTIATPTDYFRYEIAVMDANHSITNPLHRFGGDYAFLMENQWVAPLPAVGEASPDAAPDQMIVFYCDMFPFRKNSHDRTTWLHREEVTDYVGMELLPRMIEAFRIQTDEWGFPWHDAWRSWRRGQGAERLSVALSDGKTWFHGRAPFRGNAGISIRVNGGDNASYDTLTDGVMSSFHHELFHNLQRNIYQKGGGDGSVGGEENAWAFFTEGTAVMASSVGQPGVEFSQTARARAYVYSANLFLANGGPARGDLNRSYGRMSPYDAALYWRFLYEQCGGNAVPAAGMRVIHRALEALYAGDIVDVASSTDLVGKLPVIVDHALADSTCPFQTHADSLIAFARANYALRLENGRCGLDPAECGSLYYDPNLLYTDPPLEAELAFSGAPLTYRGTIPSSYGMDLVEVQLDRSVRGQQLTLKIRAEGDVIQLNIQAWRLGPGQTKPWALTPQPEIVPADAHGEDIYVIPQMDTTAYDRLALIITRLDANERVDSVGEYQVTVR